MMAANYAARLLKSCKNVIYSYNGECVRMKHAGEAKHSTGLNVGSSMVIVFLLLFAGFLQFSNNSYCKYC